MSSKDILKEAFDSDMQVLEKAFEQDKKLADMAAEWTTNTLMKIGRLLDILVKHDLITIEEAMGILKSEQIEKEKNETNK